MTALFDLTRSAQGSTPEARLAKTLRAVVLAARAVLLWPARVYANRQLLERMGCMSDHELSDIGLSRGDLADSTALPLTSEVGFFLAKRAHARRGAFRRTN